MPLELADFNLSEEQREFREMLRRFFEEHAPIAVVRRVMEADRSGFDPAAWSLASEELGLAGLAIPEVLGGQGFGLKELGLALGEVGRGLAPVPLFASAGLAGRVVAAVAEDDAERWLAPIAAGEAATLAWVEAEGDWDPAATRLEVDGAGDTVRLRGAKEYVLAAREARRIFVVAREPGSRCDEGLGLFAVEADAAGLSVDALQAVDLTRAIHRVRFDDTPAVRVGAPGQAAPGVRVGLDESLALLCAEMVGGMQKVLETAVDHANERYQFSRPIGSFQAIKHKCANLLIDFEGARTATDGALVAFDEGDPERFELACVAKAHTGPAYLRMAIDGGQIQGGVGYTWEYDAHLYFRRAMACRAFLGDESVQHERLASTVARQLAQQEVA